MLNVQGNDLVLGRLNALFDRIQDYNQNVQMVDENTMFNFFAMRKQLYKDSMDLDLVKKHCSPE